MAELFPSTFPLQAASRRKRTTCNEFKKRAPTPAQLGWSRNVLLNQIKAGAYERADTEKKTHNFPVAPPEHFAEQDDIEVEFVLKTKRNPIGVAEYHLQPKLPAEFKGRLPTARQLANSVRDVMPPSRPP